jgi:nitrite reductase (NO-forming)
MTSYTPDAPATLPPPKLNYRDSDSHALLVVGALALGLIVVVLGVFLVFVWNNARGARTAAEKAAASTPVTAAPAAMNHTAVAPAEKAVASPSFAATVPANADQLAAAHKAYPAELPAVQAGPVARVNLSIQHRTLEIAPGIEYETWTLGDTAPGPVIHVRQGQRVEVTLTNDSPMPHSIDFHAARIAPDKAFVDIAPGKSFLFSFTAGDPGVYMYHCGTKPVLAHIANGMYGAIVVDPADPKLLPPVHHSYVLISSEWYLNSPGLDKPAALDMTKARNMTPDWVTWNGYAGQYVKHPLEAHPGHTTSFYVVAAGPSLDTDFHVVGTLLNRAWINQDVTQYQRNVQTALVPAGGGAIFDVNIKQPGLYPFVSHSFASVDMGQVGLLKVGDVEDTMSH